MERRLTAGHGKKYRFTAGFALGMLLVSVFFQLIFPISQGSAQPNMPVPGKTDSPTQESMNSGQAAERYITIDFNNVDIVVFIKFISELTGKNFVVDQRVKGKITIISPTKISLNEAYEVFQSVLEVHGYATVPAGDVVKIIPSPDARTKSIETRLREEAVSSDDRVVTQLIPLRYADTNEIKRLFAPLVSKSSVILAYPPTNMLIVTDVSSNIKRLIRILDAIDVVGIGLELSVITLDHADAKKMVSMLGSIFKTKRKPKKGEPVAEIRFVADERTNAIVLFASEDDTIRIEKLIDMLDQETPRGKEKIRVYYLENANAEEMVKVLQDLSAKTGKAQPGKKAPIVSKDVQISADKATNSLIIMANKEDYGVIEEVIRKLDIPRAMVFIESLFMEVKVTKGFSIGVKWRALGQSSFNNQEGIYGGTYSGSSFPTDAGDTGLVNPGDAGGFAMGLIHGAINIAAGGQTITLPNLSALIEAVQTDDDIHILSTPHILTTDNEEARIVVGQNVPFQTRSSQISGTSDTFSSFEYRDVGVTLKITPQINKDRLIRLNISQEITKLTTTSEKADFKPTTLKRSFDTTVVVESNSTIVIGGLIDDTITGRESSVPCLGNVPGLRWLFKSQARGNEKTNLFVFLTPQVVKSHPDADKIYKEKRERMRKVFKEGRIKFYDKSLYDDRIENDPMLHPAEPVPDRKK